MINNTSSNEAHYYICRGGAAKRKNLFCHCFPCSSDNLALPRENPCTACAALYEPILKKRRGCSHHMVCEQTYICETMFDHDVLVFVCYGPVEQDDPEGTRLFPSATRLMMILRG
jgi:hypothetical protein